MQGSRDVAVPAVSVALPGLSDNLNGKLFARLRPDRDFEVQGGSLVFANELVEPRRDTMKTYARLMFWGRYKTEHTVDVAYAVNGRQRVASKLPISPPA